MTASLLAPPFADAVFAPASAAERFARLTARETEVLVGLSHGRSPADLAGELFVSLTTIRSHIRAILVKLEVRSQVAAVALAWRSGWEPAR